MLGDPLRSVGAAGRRKAELAPAFVYARDRLGTRWRERRCLHDGLTVIGRAQAAGLVQHRRANRNSRSNPEQPVDLFVAISLGLRPELPGRREGERVRPPVELDDGVHELRLHGLAHERRAVLEEDILPALLHDRVGAVASLRSARRRVVQGEEREPLEDLVRCLGEELVHLGGGPFEPRLLPGQQHELAVLLDVLRLGERVVERCSVLRWGAALTAVVPRHLQRAERLGDRLLDDDPRQAELLAEDQAMPPRVAVEEQPEEEAGREAFALLEVGEHPRREGDELSWHVFQRGAAEGEEPVIAPAVDDDQPPRLIEG